MYLDTPTIWLQNRENTARIERVFLNGLLANPGPVNTEDYVVSALSTPTMAVQVSAGQAWVRGSASNQGVYSVVNDGFVTLTIPTAESAPRIDLVVLKVYDTEYGDGVDQAEFLVVKGQAASSPTPPAAPTNSITLARVTVGAGVSSISNSNIVDVRVLAMFRSEFSSSIWKTADWIPMTPLQSNVVAYGGAYQPPAYRRLNDRVELTGLLTINIGAVPPSGTVPLFTMPTAYRPAKVQLLSTVAGRGYIATGNTTANGASHYHNLYEGFVSGRISINSTGLLYFQPGLTFESGQWVSLEGLVYYTV